MINRQHPHSGAVRLAVILLPIMIGLVLWSFLRAPTSAPGFSHRFGDSPAPFEPVAVSEPPLDRTGAAALLPMMLQTPLRDVPIMYPADVSRISPSVLFAPPSRT